MSDAIAKDTIETNLTSGLLADLPMSSTEARAFVQIPPWRYLSQRKTLRRSAMTSLNRQSSAGYLATPSQN